MLIFTGTIYSTIYSRQCHVVNIYSKFSGKSYICSYHDRTSCISNTIRPANEMITSSSYCSQCSRSAMFIFTSTSNSTIHSRSLNFINIYRKLSSKRNIFGYYNCASSICITVRPFHKVVTLSRCSCNSCSCSMFIFASTSHSTIFSRKHYKIFIRGKISREASIFCSYKSTSQIHYSIRPT